MAKLYGLGWVFFILIGVSLLAKTYPRLELKNADVSRGDVINGEPVRIAEGNVHVLQDSTELFCERAVYYTLQNKIVLTGNVKILHGKQILQAKKVTYFEATQLAIAEEEVFLQRPGQKMRCEYLEYFYATDQSFAKNKLWLFDEESGSYLTADRGEYLPQASRCTVEDNAHFWQIRDNSLDTLHIHARLMEYFFDSTRVAVARDSVVIIQDALEARCDSATYYQEEERVVLQGSSRAEQENNRLSGKQMEVFLRDMKVHKINIQEDARVISMEDSLLQRENILSGKEIIAFIQEEKLDQLWAIKNARCRYYLKEEGEEKGMNMASADTIQIYFNEGEVERIAVKGGSEGTYYPENNQNNIEAEQ